MTSAPASANLLPASDERCAAPRTAPTVVIATLEPVRGQTGVQTHSRTLHAGLTGIGHPCVLRTPIEGLSPWVPVFAIRPLILNRLKNKTWSTWWLRRWHEAALRGGLSRIARSHNVATVVAQCPVSARAAMEARRRLGQNFSVAMVCHFNYSEATEYREKGELSSERFFQRMLAMEKKVLESVDRVIYVSNWARDIVERERGITPKASSVIWNGVSTRVKPSKLSREDLGLGPDDVVLISVGTLEPRKNQIALVRLFAKISQRHPAANLVLVGDGPSRGEIEAAVAELGIASKVRLLGFRRDVPDLLPLADLYVHASLLENCPIVLLEAARAGLPVAAVPAGGVPELLAVLEGTPIELTDPTCLDALLTNPATRKTSGQVARAAFERHFTREAMIEAYVRTLDLSRDDGGKRRHVTTALPIHRHARALPVEERSSFTDKYLFWVCLILLGYALDGRGFAYFFMGEMALVLGFAILVNLRGWTGVFNSPILLLLLPFWGWGLARTIPFVKTYRVDAIRDAMLFGYSGFAFIIAGLIIAKPARFITLLRRYRIFAFIFLLIIPLVFAAFRALGKSNPNWPVLGVPMIHEKEGDIMVHLASIFAFWIAGIDSKVNPIWVVLLIANAAVIGVVDRAGQVAFMAAFAVCAIARPTHPVITRVIVAGILVTFALWVTNIHIPMVKGREISFDQIVTNFKSMTGDTGSAGLDSTKKWRVDWWNKIEQYSLYGPYRWTGKGFGVNLAEDDGFQVLTDNSLRSPHNAHMNILAHMGIPGVVMWAIMHLAWAAFVAAGYFKARIRNDSRWQAVFLFLFCSWMCFLINSSFDVYLEGPMGAVWFWCVWGMGAAAVYLYKQRPEILYVS